jgi:hypothetical protein
MINLRKSFDTASVGFLLVLILSALARAQDKPGLPAYGTTYSNAALGFRYKFPGGMHDETA